MLNTALYYGSSAGPAIIQPGHSSVSQHRISNNLKVLGLLSNEAWNTTNLPGDWQANNAEVAGGSGDNTYIQNFETNAARVLMPHFSGKIDNWQVWNEPN